MDINITIDLTQDVKDLLKALTGKVGASVAASSPAPAKQTGKPTKLKKAPDVDPEEDFADGEDGGGEDDDEDLTVEKVREIVTEFIQQDPEDNKEKVKALLKKFKVTAITNLPEEKFASFIEKLKAA